MAKRRVLVTDPKFPENGKEQPQDFFFQYKWGHQKIMGNGGYSLPRVKRPVRFIHNSHSYTKLRIIGLFVCLFVCLLSHASNFISPFTGLMCLQGMHKIMHCNITLDP